MNDLADILKEFFLELLISFLVLCFIVFLLKDVYYNNFEPHDLQPYASVILGGLIAYSVFLLLFITAGIFLTLMNRRHQVLLGFILGGLLNILFTVYLYFFLNDYLNQTSAILP